MTLNLRGIFVNALLSSALVLGGTGCIVDPTVDADTGAFDEPALDEQDTDTSITDTSITDTSTTDTSITDTSIVVLSKTSVVVGEDGIGELTVHLSKPPAVTMKVAVEAGPALAGWLLQHDTELTGWLLQFDAGDYSIPQSVSFVAPPSAVVSVTATSPKGDPGFDPPAPIVPVIVFELAP